MANTVNYLTFANTFGDWVVTTNNLARENNDLAANNYIKPTGTLYLNDPTLGLQVANNAIIAGQLQVQGIGSSAYIQNNLQVGTQVYFSNSVLGLTNSGDMIVGGSLSVGGNFVINGSTVNSSNNFTLNSNNTVGINSTFNVYRGSSGANASILWNETVDQWQLLNNADSTYYRILTTNEVTSSLVSTSSNTAASAAAANALSSAITTANTSMKSYVDTANTSMKSYVDTANTSMKSYVDANVALNAGINNTQNTNITLVNQFAGGAYNTANGANGLAAGAYNAANGANGLAAGAFNTANGANGLAAGAYNTANAVNSYAQSIYNSSNTKVSSITGTTNQITVTGTTTPTLSLPQNINTGASVQFGSFGVGTAASGTTGEIRATNNITAYYSDDRLKTKLGNIESALDKVMSLNGFYHEANETAQALGYEVVREVGVSAQEVNAVLPEVVAPAPIDPQYMTVRYERLVPLLIEAIKELKSEIDSLKKS
jgi:hypothetical protein